MFRAIALGILLSISLVHAGVFRARGSLVSKSLPSQSFKHLIAEESVLAQMRNIFGVDDRIPMVRTDYPWSAIGKLSTGCTGTLVGSDLVLTAAHCVIDSSTHRLYQTPIYFYANMINGVQNNQARISYVWWGTNKPDESRENDWALLRLDMKLGNTQGWFATRLISIDAMKTTPGTLVGYSQDFRGGETAGIHTNCKIIKQSRPNLFLHDCDNTRGASGGPIFAYWNNQPTIYALNVGDFRNDGDTSLKLSQYTDENANIAIWSSALQQKILELQNS